MKQVAQKGYIALISAILISVSLLTMVIAVSFEGYFSRFNVLESEQKEISDYLAESCFNRAVIELSQDEEYDETPIVEVGEEECTIIDIEDGTFPSNRLISVQGVNGEAYTNLEIEIDLDSLPEVDVISWVEVGSF
jgi:hypothetical protein